MRLLALACAGVVALVILASLCFLNTRGLPRPAPDGPSSIESVARPETSKHEPHGAKGPARENTTCEAGLEVDRAPGLDPALIEDLSRINDACGRGTELSRAIARFECQLHESSRISVSEACSILAAVPDRHVRSVLFLVVARLDPDLFEALRSHPTDTDLPHSIKITGLLGLTIEPWAQDASEDDGELFWREMFNQVVYLEVARIQLQDMFLAHTGPPRSSRARGTLLEQALHGDDPRLRSLSALLLRPCRETEDVTAAYVQLLSTDASSDVRQVAAEALSGVPAPTAVQALDAALDHDPAEDVRVAAVRALSAAKDPAVIESLMRKFYTIPGLGERRALIRGIGPSAVPTVTSFLARIVEETPVAEPEGTALVCDAINALAARRNDHLVAPAILRAVSSPDWTTRVNAVGALGRLGDRSVVPRLKSVAESDPDAYVRKTARHAVEELLK